MVTGPVGAEALESSPGNYTPSNPPDAVVCQEQLVHYWAPESRVRRDSVSTLPDIEDTSLTVQYPDLPVPVMCPEIQQVSSLDRFAR